VQSLSYRAYAISVYLDTKQDQASYPTTAAYIQIRLHVFSAKQNINLANIIRELIDTPANYLSNRAVAKYYMII